MQPEEIIGATICAGVLFFAACYIARVTVPVLAVMYRKKQIQDECRAVGQAAFNKTVKKFQEAGRMFDTATSMGLTLEEYMEKNDPCKPCSLGHIPGCNICGIKDKHEKAKVPGSMQ